MSSPVFDLNNETSGRNERTFSVASNIMHDTMPDTPREGVNQKDEVTEIFKYSYMDINWCYFIEWNDATDERM